MIPAALLPARALPPAGGVNGLTMRGFFSVLAQVFFAAQGFLAAPGFGAAHGFWGAQGLLGAQGFWAAQGFPAHGFLAAHGFLDGFAAWTGMTAHIEALRSAPRRTTLDFLSTVFSPLRNGFDAAAGSGTGSWILPREAAASSRFYQNRGR